MYGDYIKMDELLGRLDHPRSSRRQPRVARWAVIAQEAQLARRNAERDSMARIAMPTELDQQPDDVLAKAAIKAEKKLFGGA